MSSILFYLRLMGTIGPGSFLDSPTIAGNLNAEANMSQRAPEEGSIHKVFVTILSANYEALTVFVKDHMAAVCLRKLMCLPAKQCRRCGWASDETQRLEIMERFRTASGVKGNGEL